MRVKIYDHDQTGAEVFRAECDAAECFPDDANELRRALGELMTVGRYWAGGGAAPLVLLMRANSA